MYFSSFQLLFETVSLGNIQFSCCIHSTVMGNNKAESPVP